MRALLDPCSETSLGQLSLVRRFGTARDRVEVPVSGAVGRPMDSARLRAFVYLYPLDTGTPIKIEVYGLRCIDITTPPSRPTDDITRHYHDLRLADPDFAVPRGVDIILGANVYGRLLRPGFIRRGDLLAQETTFGWVICGQQRGSSRAMPPPVCIATKSRAEEPCRDQLVGLLQRFWSVEEMPEVTRR